MDRDPLDMTVDEYEMSINCMCALDREIPIHMYFRHTVYSISVKYK